MIKEKKTKFLIFFFLILALFFLITSQLLFQPFQLTPSQPKDSLMTKENSQSEPNKPSPWLKVLAGENHQTELPENILLLGKVGQGYPGENLTDTIILLHLDKKTKQAALISLPRDLLVQLPNGRLTKINNLYQTAGIKFLQTKVKEITGLKPDHYLVIDLEAVKEIVDLVGGLNVLVPQDIKDDHFPGANYSYQPFTLKAGWRYLDGQNTLRYIRSRYTSPEGDFDRMARQQQIIGLLKQKLQGLKITKEVQTYLQLFKILSQHLKSDLSLNQLAQLWPQTKEFRQKELISLVIDKKKTHLLTSGLISFGNQMASVVWPQAGQTDYSAIQSFINQRLNQ